MPEKKNRNPLDLLRSLFKFGQTDSGKPEPIIEPANMGADVTNQFDTNSPFTIYSNNANEIAEKLAVDQELTARYTDYEHMDDDPIISTAMDIYADDSTQTDRLKGRSIWAESKDANIKKEIDRLFYKVLDIDSTIWEISRTMCKYGNNFERLIVTPKGVVGLDFISPAQIRRYEADGEYGFLTNTKGEFRLTDSDVIKALRNQDTLGKGNMAFEDWNIAHFRIRTKNRGSRYGYGVGESARWAWKRLSLLEDATVIYKITRTPSRTAYYINVGSMPPQQGYAFANKVKQQARKKRILNPTTGKIELSPHLISQNEDLYIPVREGKDPTRVEMLSGSDYQSIEVVDYFKDKLFSALKVPKAFLSYDENMPSRATLSMEDLRFARTELRVQRELMKGVKHIVDVHFASQGINPKTLDYQLSMTVPSSAMESAQMEVEMTRTQLASQYGEFVSKEWILGNLFNFTDAEIKKALGQRKKENADEFGESISIDNDGLVEESRTKGQAVSERKLEKKLNEVKGMLNRLDGSRKEVSSFMNDVKSTLGNLDSSIKKSGFENSRNIRKIVDSFDVVGSSYE